MVTMSHPSGLQNSLHNLLNSYINGGCLNRADRTLSLFSIKRPFQRNARRVCDTYQTLCKEVSKISLPHEIVTIEPYVGNNTFVKRMKQQLESDFKRELAGAYVHGSLGTQEEIAYSDFDAVVILKDDLFHDGDRLVDVAMRLSHARRIMFEADPLQHHGWFVLTEADMRYYCDAHFPKALWTFSKSLLSNEREKLLIKRRNSVREIRDAFYCLAMSCLQIFSNYGFLKNVYLMKCALSQFMLLPSMYVHARDGEGVYKKFSFDKAREDFRAEEWECMDRISQLRNEWSVSFGPFSKFILSRSGTLRSPIAKMLAPSNPNHLRSLFTSTFIEQMVNLTQSMQYRLSVVLLDGQLRQHCIETREPD